MSSSSTSPHATKMISLKSCDGETFEIEQIAALQSKTLEGMIQENCADDPVPLPSISSKTLAKVIQFCNKHVEPGVDAESLRAWDEEFVNVDHPILFDLILAANFLEIQSLLELSTSAVAEMMRGKTPDEIRKLFNISNAFTPEEEEEVRRENQWAFD